MGPVWVPEGGPVWARGGGMGTRVDEGVGGWPQHTGRVWSVGREVRLALAAGARSECGPEGRPAPRARVARASTVDGVRSCAAAASCWTRARSGLRATGCGPERRLRGLVAPTCHGLSRAAVHAASPPASPRAHLGRVAVSGCKDCVCTFPATRTRLPQSPMSSVSRPLSLVPECKVRVCTFPATLAWGPPGPRPGPPCCTGFVCFGSRGVYRSLWCFFPVAAADAALAPRLRSPGWHPTMVWSIRVCRVKVLGFHVKLELLKML